MKILLSILGSLTIAGSGVAPLAGTTTQFTKDNTNKNTTTLTAEQQSTTAKKVVGMGIDSDFVDENGELFANTNNFQIQTENRLNISQFLEQYLTDHPDSELEYDLLNSLSLVNQSIQINFDLLETYKSDIELYQVLTSNDFITALNEMYHKNLLTYDSNYQIFSFSSDRVQAELNVKLFKGFYLEVHWYWLAYYKLHVNHEWSQKIKKALTAASSVGAAIAGLIDQEPASRTAIAALTIVCILMSWVFDEYDHGKGVWVGFLFANPCIGWGSNKECKLLKRFYCLWFFLVAFLLLPFYCFLPL